MRSPIGRRRLLEICSGGAFGGGRCPAAALAQTAVQRPPKPAVPDEFSVTAPVSIEVNARPLPSFDTRDRSRVRFGELEYRSGLILTSRFRGFGGLSGLRLDAKGERFIAISDKGGWFTGRIVYKGREMTGLDDVEASPMLGPDGKPITSRGWFDTESLALDGSLVYVGLERVNQVLRFDFAKGFTRALGEVVPLPPAARKLPYNKGHRGAGDGAEGLAARGNADRDLRTRPRCAGQHPRLPDRRQDRPGSSASAAPTISTSATRCCCRPASCCCWSGNSPGSAASASASAASRLPSIAPGAVIDGPSIFEADLGNEIDNMEGIDAHVTPEGDTVLTLVSDDNFSMIQRNLLLQFTLVE